MNCVTIRPGRDSDSPGIIALIASCWALYPGSVMDVDHEMPERHALASHYAEQGGALWVAEDAGAIAGMIAARPSPDGAWEICRLHVSPALHGAGTAHALLDAAETHATISNATGLFLWSDTRFDRANRFHEKRSYIRQGGIRVLHDRSNSLEFGYAKPVNGVLTLDAAGADSAGRRLAELLVACVVDGASVSFLPPLSPDKARAFWRRSVRAVSAGQRLLLAGWRDGVMVATGSVDLAMPENQVHRGEIQTLLVDPAWRRRGLGRDMLRACEAAARAAGRSLLVLDTRADDGGAALYRAEGWQEYGRLAGHAMDREARPVDTVFFAKHL
jgi:ribosomal protein S18 acetylase RimI-like enzyme